MRLALSLLLLLGACSDREDMAAPSASALAGRTVLAGCRQGECRWARVLRVETAEKFPQGELRRMVLRSGTSVHLDGKLPTRPEDARIEWEPSDRADHAFCSKERPAYAFPDDSGGLIVHFLDLFDLAGYQYSSAGQYMRLCHDLDALPDEAKLRSLGYRPDTRSEQIEAASVEAMTRF